MNVMVRLFGPQARLAGAPRVVVRMGDAGATCAALRWALGHQHPELGATLDASRFAINHAFAEEQARIRPGDEVALIGLVCGG